jgi:hypothetical protein
MGYDEFPERVVKHCGQYLVKPLIHIPRYVKDIKNKTYPKRR